MKKPKNWEAYSRDRAYDLLGWLRRQGFTLVEPHADAIRIWMRQENLQGYRRGTRKRTAPKARNGRRG